MSSTNIQIAIKVRPLIEREKRDKLEPLWMVKENSIIQVDEIQNFIGEPYSFDHIFDDVKSNKDVYNTVVKPLVISCLEGINSTIFAYGQTSSGKTHTMLGDKSTPGILNFAVDDIFEYVDKSTNKNFLLRCSYLEIYNEKINDLLNTNAKDLKIREDYNQGVYVSVREEVIRRPEELLNLMKKGVKTRKIGCTDMNERSSRSHTIFKLVIQSQNKDSEGSYTESTLNLVDLAGSERVGQMNMDRERQVEGVSINKSLTNLGLVIRRLSENETYINYRDSKLTRLLQHSLGGNSKTLIIATITVAALEETKSTLEFAQRAKYVKNRPIKNEKITDKDQLNQYENLCGEYKDQIEKLRLEKLKADETISTLEAKICNIKLFSAGTFESASRPVRLPSRRHTLAHSNIKTFCTLDYACTEENGDNEEFPNSISPITSEVFFPITECDKDSSLFEELENSPPRRQQLPITPVTPKTPYSILKLRNKLLEESYEELKYFTTLEKHIVSESDRLKELQELTKTLSQENLQLREENLKRGDVNVKLMENNEAVYKKLVILRNLLEVKSVDNTRRSSLQAIMEEEIDLFDDDLEFSVTENKSNGQDDFMEQIECLKKQVLEQEIISGSLSEQLHTEKLKHDNLSEKILNLQDEIVDKDETIEKLKSTIIQLNLTKEAELEILNEKNEKLNNYKEQMHQKLSELQKAQDEGSQHEELKTIKRQNASLNEELSFLKEEHEGFKQISISDKHKIEELEKKIESILISSNKAQAELKSLQDINENLNLEIDKLRKENERLESEMENTSSVLTKEEHKNETLRIELEGEVEKVKELQENIKSIQSSLHQEIDKTKEETTNVLNEAYNREIEKLTVENEKNKTIIQLHEKEIRELKDLLEKQTEITKEHVKVLHESESLRSELQEALFQLTGEQEELKNLCKQLEERNERIEGLQNSIESLRNSEANKQNEIDRLNKVNVELRQAIEHKENEFKHMHELQNTNEHEETITKLQNTVQKLSLKLSDLSQQLVEKTDYINTLDKNTLTLKEDLDNKIKYVFELNSINLKLQEDLVQKNSEFEKFQEMLDQYQQLEESALDLEKALVELKANLEDKVVGEYIQQKVDKMQMLKEISNICHQLEEKAASVPILQNTIAALKNNQEMNLKEIQNLTDSNSKMQEELEKLTQTYFNLQEDALKNDISYKNIIRNLEEELSALKGTFQSQAINLEMTEKHLQDTTTQLFEKTELYNNIVKDNSGNNKLVQSLEKEISELKEHISKLEELAGSVPVLQNTIAALQNNEEINLKLQEELEKLTKTYFSLQQDALKNDTSYKNIIRNLEEELSTLKRTCHSQSIKLEMNKKQLQDTTTQLIEKTELYNNIIKDNSGNNKLVQSLEREISELKERISKLEELAGSVPILQKTIATLQNNEETNLREIQKLNNSNLKLQEELEKLTETNLNLQDALKNDTSHENIIRNLEEELSALKRTCHSQSINLEITKKQLQDTTTQLIKKTELYNNNSENNKIIQTLKQEIGQLRENMSKLPTLTEIEQMQLLLDRRSNEIKTKTQEVRNLEEELKTKLETIKTLSQEKSEIENAFMDKQRQLSERCNDFNNLRIKLNTLEFQLINSKKELSVKSKEVKMLENIKKLLHINQPECTHLPMETQISEFMRKSKALAQEIATLQKNLDIKTAQLSKANEEIVKYKQLNTDAEKYTCEYHACKLQLNNLQQEHQEIVFNLSEQNKTLLKRIVDTEKEIASLTQGAKVDQNNELSRELSDVKKRCQNLESQLNSEKITVMTLTTKLEKNELEIINLQTKLCDLKSKKNIPDAPDKKPVSRLSDEGTSLSPNALRRLKRQSIHDERRGLSPSDNSECNECATLRTQLFNLQKENGLLLEERDKLKRDHDFLDKENADMLVMIKEYKKSEISLYEQLEKAKSKIDSSSNELELNKIRMQLAIAIAKNTQLNNDLQMKNEMMQKLNDKLTESQNLVGQTRHRLVTTANKEVQVTCDLQRMCDDYKSIARLRGAENNYLRKQLNLPPNCPVLPQDVKHARNNMGSQDSGS